MSHPMARTQIDVTSEPNCPVNMLPYYRTALLLCYAVVLLACRPVINQSREPSVLSGERQIKAVGRFGTVASSLRISLKRRSLFRARG